MNKDKKQWKIEMMTVTPEMAGRWLAANEGNRHMSPHQIENMVRDIRQNAWRTTHEPIAFDTNGRLIDGQHRLTAVVEAQKPVQVFVAFNCPPESALWIDQGRKRSLSDAARFYDTDITRKVESTTRAMLDVSRQIPTTRHEQLAFYKRHRTAILWATTAFSNAPRRICKAQVTAVLARAFYTQDRGRLEEFVRILKDGMIINLSDKPAIMLRDHLLQGDDKAGKVADPATKRRVEVDRRWIYRRAEYLLTAFINKRSASSNRSVIADAEMFLIPGDQGYAKSAA